MPFPKDETSLHFELKDATVMEPEGKGFLNEEPLGLGSGSESGLEH